MILQALTQYYDALLRQGKVSAPGWGPVKVSYALCIDASGALERVIPVLTEQVRGKKTVMAPQNMNLPRFLGERTANIMPYFLCDGSDYILGIDNTGGTSKRTNNRFIACKNLHEDILKGVDSSAAQAVLAFFQSWNPETAANHPALAEHWDGIVNDANLVFYYDGRYVHDDPDIRRAWIQYYNASGNDGESEMVCLVTGEKRAAANIHPAIKGVQGAKPRGAPLVSFNAPAFCSFGKEQNYNAPTSRAAAFAYTTALNYLVADRERVQRMGDATVVCWSSDGEAAYQGFFCTQLSGKELLSESALQGMMAELCRGHAVLFDETMLDPDMDFYVLGLSPNAARLSVRFFLRNTFGAFLRNIEAHRERLKIVRPSFEKFETPSLKRLLDCTVNQNARDKAASPEMAGEMLRAILNDTPYPATLLNGVTLRIRAEQRDKDHPDRPFKMTWERAAILKAYTLQNFKYSPRYDILQEVFQMDLNENCTYLPYILGRLFCVMEKIQLASADWNLNRTIKDSYFNAAATTPKNIFAKLFPLSEYHMKKLLRDKPGLAHVLDEEKQLISSKITVSIPSRFTLEETNCFYIGYYHQSYKKSKEGNKNV